MKPSIDKVEFPIAIGLEWNPNENCYYMETQGCGCCSGYFEVDKKDLDKLIKDTEETLSKLKTIKNEIFTNKVPNCS